MTQSVAVALVAFFCLAVSVATGLATQGRVAVRLALPGSPAVLRMAAGGLLALAALGLGVLTMNTRAEFQRAEAHTIALAQDVRALDQALRQVGAEAEPARLALFRYADSLAHSLYGPHVGRREPVAVAPAVLEDDLLQAVAALPDSLAGRGAALGRLEMLCRTAHATLGLVPPPGLKWCQPILLAWMMLGLGLLALVVPPHARSAILMTVLVGVLSGGLFLLEEMASPFEGTFTVTHAVLDETLFAIAD